MKTRLGISVGLFAAGMYFAGLVSGYVVLLLMVGYVLLVEPNPWLRKTAVKAFAVSLTFSLLSLLLGFLPTTLGMVTDLLNVFNVYLDLNKVYSLLYLLQTSVNVVGDVLMLILGILAIGQGTIPMGPIDKLINRHM